MIIIKSTNNTNLKKDINDLFKKLGINAFQDKNEKKVLNDYKLHSKFPTKFSQGKLTMTNSTK